MITPSQGILAEAAAYYSARLAEHGATARGVDWNSEESQKTRFAQLTRVIDLPSEFSINDLGCGYGALYDFMLPAYPSFAYNGYDVSEEMVRTAIGLYATSPAPRFLHAYEPDREADYGIASGIFNVKQERTDNEWKDYLTATLNVLNRTSRRGFSFNCLTSYSDSEKMKPSLYYADPCWLFDYCKKCFSRQVALLHDYPLYEFTIIVRKSAA